LAKITPPTEKIYKDKYMVWYERGKLTKDYGNGSSINDIEDPFPVEDLAVKVKTGIKFIKLRIFKSHYNDRFCKLWTAADIDGTSYHHRLSGPAFRSMDEGVMDWVEYWEYGRCLKTNWVEKGE